jgi:hypothetical protein
MKWKVTNKATAIPARMQNVFADRGSRGGRREPGISASFHLKT